MAKHILVVYNPTARSQTRADKWVGEFVAEITQKEDFLVTLFPTTAETRPADLVPLLKDPIEMVVAAGGDGTIRTALAALAMAKSDIPAALMPLGTGNVLARNLGIVDEKFFSQPLANAVDALLTGVPIKIDMGMMNGEYFAGMAGVGPLSDAFVNPARHLKTRYKMMAYVVALLDTITKRPGVFKITTGGHSFKVQASGVFVGNVADLGLGKTADIKHLFDGKLDLHILDPKELKDYVSVGFRFAAGVKDVSMPYYVMGVKEVVIEPIPRKGIRSSFQKAAQKIKNLFLKEQLEPGESPRVREMMAMIDGEEAGHPPMRITVIPNAVTVMVPEAVGKMLRDEEQTAVTAAQIPQINEIRQNEIRQINEVNQLEQDKSEVA